MPGYIVHYRIPWQSDGRNNIPSTVHNQQLQTTRCHSAADLDGFREAWTALAADSPMRSPEWSLAWWENFAGPHDELCVLLFQEPGGRLVGLAPLFLEVAGSRRTIRLIGSGEVSTNHTTWLAAAGWQSRISSEVARFLLELRPAWNALRFDSCDADDRAIGATVSHLAEAGFLVQRTRLQRSWEIALPPSWEDYLRSLSKSRRKRCRKQQHDYFESGRVQVKRVTCEADFPQGFDILVRLHAARWGEATRPLGCFSDQRFRRFHERIARELLARGQLLLVWLEFEGRPVAAEYQFIDREKVYSYQAGMDPAVTELSPGNLSIMASIQFAIGQGCRFFDLSRGDQPYKASWSATPVEAYDILIWPGDLPGRLKYLSRQLRDRAEQGRLGAVRWVKARVPARYIEAWRQQVYRMGGKRLGPRKLGHGKDERLDD